jgi:hypothetical protein
VSGAPGKLVPSVRGLWREKIFRAEASFPRIVQELFWIFDLFTWADGCRPVSLADASGGLRANMRIRKTMSVDKAKDMPPKKPIAENKIVEAKPESSTGTESKPDAAAKKQGMGEGQKPVSKAYKDNWNDIFGKKKKR